MPRQLSDFPGLFPGASIEIWYQRTEYARDLMLGILDSFDSNSLSKTHVLLGTIGRVHGSYYSAGKSEALRPLDPVYLALQGENWSPEGEAHDLIRSKNLSHTSMCCGDVVCFPEMNETYILVFGKGWKKV